MAAPTVVRSEVSEVGFGFFTDDELIKLSACKIVSPISQDSLGNSLTGGLYDPRLGPISATVNCVTCSMSYFHCPGHSGHIELDVPVYRPLLFTSMLQLLKSKCAYCHRFRMGALKVRQVLVKLKLLEMGDITNAEALDHLSSAAAGAVLEDVVAKADLVVNIESRLEAYERRYDNYCRNKGRRPAGLEIKTKQRAVIDAFFKVCNATKKCECCGAYSPQYRKDGFSKVFQRPLNKRTLKAMSALKLKLKTALEATVGDLDNEAQGSDSDSDEVMDEDDDDDEAEDASPTKSLSQKRADAAAADKFMVPLEVEAQIKLLWRSNADILDFIWSRAVSTQNDVGMPSRVPNPDGWKLFFQRVVLVPPNRFRPMSKVGEGSADHPQNHNLSQIIETNERIRRILIETNANSAVTQSGNDSESDIGIDDVGTDKAQLSKAVQSQQAQSGLSRIVTAWIDLQNAVNCYIDSAKNPNPLGSAEVPGIRQLLERKEGLFRRHMMGKRVNYCCRSVISPDPYIGTNEVGIPVAFAKTLHYPVPVNDWNVKHLRRLVEAGPTAYPGANQIELGDGKIIKLEKLSFQERAARARLLQATPGIKVYRHLVDGDMLLVNRQPTLHKPGIMAHKARVFKHVREQTIRLSYANCSSYNADFDGDEMNCHFVQNDIARAEAATLCNTDNQYIVPTSGNPLRGLIQDHVVSAVKLTCRDTFLSKAEFQQLLHIAVTGLPGTEIISVHEEITMPLPTIFKPVPLWTGKQVISSLIKHLCRPPLPSLHLDGKTRTPPTAFGADQNEHIVIFRFGELLCGVMDKAAIGNSSLGIVHAVYELYGAELAGRLLNAFGRLCTYYLQDAGQSCGIEDLTLTLAADKERKRLLQKVGVDAEIGLCDFLAGQKSSGFVDRKSTGAISEDERVRCQDAIEAMIVGDRKNAKSVLDSSMQSVINKSASDVIKVCIPNGLELPFQQNDFAMMVLTGAKGSAVNLSQISCFLGQQALEGMRVPIMISGKSLPSFRPYDPSARAGGFVQDRFLTGVKPQEYYFHCMAGREGLVDTAVKTSRSGYLQRCLVKHLEELKVNYDMTVRDSGGNVVQFLYGEDGLDPVNTALLGGKDNQMSFMARNNQALVHKYALHSDFFSRASAGGLEMDSAPAFHSRMLRAKQLLCKVRSDVASKQVTQIDATSEILSKGSVVMARRKKNSQLVWGRNNIKPVWELAEVIKVRKADKHGKESRHLEDSVSEATYDIQYASDGLIEKKMNQFINHSSRRAGCLQSSKLILLKAALPDPAMNSLKLNTAVGAVSEKVQDAITKFIASNPDGVISDNTSDTTVSASAFELLVWVKYLRSLACPGEAVGCVAAQSVGEPSTQMTLNTFHLAGHGGANVTLGIPRLREILMTAAKTPKTPTMFIPIKLTQQHSISGAAPSGSKEAYMTKAKVLAGTLSRLTLSTLLNHQGGVEVRERLLRGASGWWERKYSLKLSFESPAAIHAAFGVRFDEVVATVKGMFLQRLGHLIRLEQRRAGQKSNGKQDQDALQQFRSKGGDPETSGNRRSTRNEDEGGDDGDGADGDADGSSKQGGRKANAWRDEMDDEDEDEDDVDDRDDEEQGTLILGSKKEVIGYEDDDEDANDDTNGVESGDSDSDAGVATKSKMNEIFGEDSESELVVASDSDESSVAHEAPKTPRSKGKSTVGDSGKKVTGKGHVSFSPATKSGRTSAKYNEDGFVVDPKAGTIELHLSFDAASRRILMVQLAERAAYECTVRTTKNISNAYAVTSEVSGYGDGAGVQTEGVNFEAIFALPESLVEFREIKCNDVWRVLLTYGVEAARTCIVSEIIGVFGMYGIDVNPRHLSLIADFMTRTGSYVALNRMGMWACPSPFLQMSFETTCTFLNKAAQEGLCDTQESPSARLVLGSVAKVGTGCCDLLVPLAN